MTADPAAGDGTAGDGTAAGGVAGDGTAAGGVAGDGTKAGGATGEGSGRSRRLVKTTPVEAPVQALEAWHLRPGAVHRMLPPWEDAAVVAEGDPSRPGARVEFRIRIGPLSRRWISEVRELPGERGFRDVQLQGPFARWRHDHLFRSLGEDRSELEDRVEYSLPLGLLGRLAAGPVVARRLERTFDYRGRIVSGDVTAHRRYSAKSDAPWPLTVAVTGSTGLVGSALVPYLRAGGHRVLRLVRGRPTSPDEVAWEPLSGLPNPEALEDVDAVVHLAGENVAGRWTEERKARILRSRDEGTRRLAGELASLGRPPRVFVSASGVNYYGDRGEELLDEESPPGEGFLAEVARRWEAGADPLRAAGSRVVNLRFGMMLSPAGGALAAMLPIFRTGLGGPLGSGRQFVSWIALDDVLDVILHALASDELSGPVNAVSPESVRNAELAGTLGRVLSRPAPFRVPGWLLRTVAGQAADEMLLASVRVDPRALREAGHRFRHVELEAALRHLLGRS